MKGDITMDSNVKKMQEELLALMLKRAKLTKKDLYNVAEKSFVINNIDLLTSQEVAKYKGKVLL